MKAVPIFAFAGCLLGSASAALAAEPQRLTLGAGVHYSEGDYATSTSTEITSLALSARYDLGRWTFRGTLPWLEVSGSGAVVPGVGQVRGGAAGRSTASGFGDAVVSASYSAFYYPAAQAGIDFTGRIKLGTADDERLGTAETDYGFQADAYKTFGALTVFGGLGYTFFGSSSAFRLDDVFNATLGASYRIDPRDSVGLIYDEREAVSSAASELSELMLFWSRQLDRAWKAQVYFLVGLADGSPDWGAGLSAAYSF
jgi:hypothetical protein